MAYIVQPTADIWYVDDSLLATYQAAGWTQATPAQVAAWQATDQYHGTQGVPPAPPLVSSATPGATAVAPAPITIDNSP